MTQENRKRPGRPSAPPRPAPAKEDATETLPENVDRLPNLDRLRKDADWLKGPRR